MEPDGDGLAASVDRDGAAGLGQKRGEPAFDVVVEDVALHVAAGGAKKDVAFGPETPQLGRTLEQLGRWRSLPKAIRCDNGPEITSQTFADWCASHDIEIWYIQPGKPNQNPFIERFNRTYRQEVLDAHLFESLDQVREVTEQWLHTYNEIRPHDALGRIPPAAYRRQLEAREISTSERST